MMLVPNLRADLRREYLGLVEIDQPDVLRQRHVSLHLEKSGTQFKDIVRLETPIEFWPKTTNVDELFNKRELPCIMWPVHVLMCA